MEVRVVIPTVDRSDTLLRAVKACLAQDHPFEFVDILVVDNSQLGQQQWIMSAENVSPGVRAALRYVHEPKRGLAQARNRGVAEPGADFIVFLDDDEMPADAKWLEALVSVLTRTGADASFGPVVPVWDGAEKKLRAPVERLFSRRFNFASGNDLTRLYDNLGAGNSCYRWSRCFSGRMSGFDPRFNEIGGEDVEFLRRLAKSGRRMVWCSTATVEEFIPQSRLDPSYMQQRRFGYGQLRSYLQIASPPRRFDLLLFWMLIGMTQIIYHAIAGLGAISLGRTESAASHRLELWGGLGKILWQKRFRRWRYVRQ